MSSENVELARRAANAWNEGGTEAFLEYLDPGVVWEPPPESMEPGTYRGHDGVRNYIERLGEIFPERHVEPVEVIELDEDRVLALIRVFGKSERFGIEIDTTWAWLVRFSNGKATRIDVFVSKEAALEAANAR